ncbi:MAG: glutamine synthetase family protein [Pseudomonadota bacterium]
MTAPPKLTMLCWNDYLGITRGRGVPTARLDQVRRNGLGWAVAGTALDPFGGIVDNPWGPMDEVRQVPDFDARLTLPDETGGSTLDMVLVRSRSREDGSPWECCPRHILETALSALHEETGARLMVACEHEFTYTHPDIAPGAAFTLDSVRRYRAFADALVDAADAAGLAFETVEPEFGLGQVEVCTKPIIGLAGVDAVVLGREAIREVARRQGGTAHLVPKLSPDAVGNGAHIHFSFLADDDAPIGFDPDGSHEMSALTSAFVAGIFEHIPALTALCAPSPVSYLRLGPQHWSCGFAAFGVQNRECAVRICPSPDPDPTARAKGYNVEYRPIDATCNPHLALAALVYAGLDGVRRGLSPPPIVETDPADLDDADRQRLGVVPLPASLPVALAAFEADTYLAGCFPERFMTVFSALKRFEIERAAERDDAANCRAYADVY